jgi:thymidylate synthase (FAD)
MPNIIDASYEILEFPENPLLSIERASRVCYKSEDKISQGSAESLVARLIKSGHHAMIEFGGWIVVKFYSNRGFTHELVRMRLASFAQESTRYCNYAKDKFGREITCIDPDRILAMKIADSEKRALYKSMLLDSWAQSQESYLALVDAGCPAEIAREALCIGLKAEIVIGADVREWRHILSLRTSKKAHPRMREVMIPLVKDFMSRTPILFDGIYKEEIEN